MLNVYFLRTLYQLNNIIRHAGALVSRFDHLRFVVDVHKSPRTIAIQGPAAGVPWWGSAPVVSRGGPLPLSLPYRGEPWKPAMACAGAGQPAID